MLARFSPLLSRSALPLLLLAAALAPACKGSSAPPTPTPTTPGLSNVTLHPATAVQNEGGGSVVASFSVDVADGAGDLSALEVGVRDPSGAVIGSTSVALTHLAGAASGTVSATVSLPTAALGAFAVTFQARDAAGVASNMLHATFTVVRAPPPEPPPLVVPVLSALSPSSAETGVASVELTATGSGLELGSVLYWNGMWLPTTFVDGGTLRATVAGSIIAMGDAQVWVRSAAGQLSNVLTFTVTQPAPPPPPVAPVLTAISPANVEAGSGDFTITATGSGFDASCSVYFNGTWLNTTLVDAGTLRATVSSYQLGAAGTRSVSVRTLAGGVSSLLTFTVDPPAPRPLPVLTALSPAAVDAGSGPVEVTLSGSGFHPSSSVIWGGGYGYISGMTYVSSTELRATLSAYALSSPGSFSLKVTTPAPGGGTSGSVPFEVRVPAIPGVRLLSLAARDVAWDPYLQKLYLSVPSTSPLHANAVAVLDPFTGTVEGSHFAGSEPGPLALSDDGQLLYVGHGGASNVTRFALPGWTVDLTIPLGRDAYSGAYTASSLSAAPGAPQTLVASLTAGSYPGATVVFDDATARAGRGAGSSAICWGTTASQLYAAGSYASELSVYPVDAAGLGTPVVYRSALYAAGQLQFDPGTGLLYASDGRSVDPATGALAGTFTLSNTYAAAMVPDSSLGRAYFAVTSGYGTSLQIQPFDLAGYTPGTATALPYIPGPAMRVVRWGPDGLAILVSGQVILVRGPAVLPLATSDNPAPTLSALAPASVTAGTGNLRVTVTGSGFVPGAVVRVGGAERFTRRLGATQLVAYVPASDLAVAGTLPVAVTNPAPGGGTSAELSLTVQP